MRTNPKLVACLLLLVLASQATFSQVTRITPWQDDQAYEPMPVLLIHGIASDSRAWSNAVAAFQSSFSVYSTTNAAPTQLGGQPAAAYLETYDYGRYGQNIVNDNAPTRGSQQTFDSIASNAWYGVAGHPTLKTLRARIEDLRIEYRLSTDELPRLTLAAHSTGGVIAHYYLTAAVENSIDPGVARLITYGCPHYGSHLANWMRGKMQPDSFINWVRFPKTMLLDRPFMGSIGLGGQVGSLFDPSLSGWNIDNFARYAEPAPSHREKTAMRDLSIHVPGSSRRSLQNPLIPYFESNAVPGDVELVLNSFNAPPTGLNTGLLFYRNILDFDFNFDEFKGDGVVPIWSQQGRSRPETNSTIFAGNSSSAQPIRPVIFSGWTNFHVGETEVLRVATNSLVGVPYRWSSLNREPTHAYTQSGLTETNSFSKYLPPTETGGSVAHTDEPGVAVLQLLYERSGQNPLLIPSLNTWEGTPPQKTQTNATDFVTHQVVSGGAGSVRGVGIVGTKNRSENPVGTSGTNYWVTAGNEYLPASLSLQTTNAISPIAVATNVSMLAAVQIVADCLVQLDGGGAPQFQYGYFENSSGITGATNNYIAVQGYNLAQLLTPQTERAFNTPVDSVTVADILTFINQAESLSNACHTATQTMWQTTVSEWVRVPSNGVVVLDFFPVSPTPTVRDAWTNVVVASGNYTYVATNTTFTFNTTNAPSQVIISNVVYLGCEKVFTNSYNGIVPALTDNTLAGVPMTGDFLNQMRTALEGVLYKYKTNTACIGCAGYDLPTALHAAGIPSNTWSAVGGGLIQSNHIAELQAVINILTNELDCCCSNVHITVGGSLPVGFVDIAYTGTVSAANGCASYSYAVTSNSLPPGLSLTISNDIGWVIGTPTTGGTYDFAISVTDTNGCSTNAAETIVIRLPCSSCPESFHLVVSGFTGYGGLCGPSLNTDAGGETLTRNGTNCVWNGTKWNVQSSPDGNSWGFWPSGSGICFPTFAANTNGCPPTGTFEPIACVICSNGVFTLTPN